MDAVISLRLAEWRAKVLGSSDVEEVRRHLNGVDEMMDALHEFAHVGYEHLDRLQRVNRSLFGESK